MIAVADASPLIALDTSPSTGGHEFGEHLDCSQAVFSLQAHETSPNNYLRNPLSNVPAQVFKQPSDQGCPAGLVVRAKAAPGFAVKIFVKQNQSAPVRIAGEPGVVSEARPLPFRAGQEESRETGGKLTGDQLQVQPLA